jgi:hypothetical protein
MAAAAAAAMAAAAAAATADTTEVLQEAAVLDTALVPGQDTTEAGVAATGERATRAPPMTEAATEEGTVVGLPREEVRTTGVSGAAAAGDLQSEREIGIVMPLATPLQLWPVLSQCVCGCFAHV